MKYAEIIQVRILHPYFHSGFCPDLEIQPLAETRKLLEGRRCLVQKRADRLTVLAELNAQGDLMLSLEAGLKLEFGLTVQNGRFYQNTQLPAPSAGQVLFSTTGATILGAGHLALAQSHLPEKKDQHWAHAEIQLASEITQPPASALLYDIALEAAQGPWQVYLSTAQTDDNLRIEGGSEGIYFHKTALSRLKGLQTDYDAVSSPGTEEYWQGSDQGGAGMDFSFLPGELHSQGPASAADIFASTQVAPFNGISWHFELELGFTPDAANRFELALLAQLPDPEDAQQDCCLLRLGDANGNRLRLLKREAGSPEQEIGAGVSQFSGPVSLQVSVRWKDGEWTVEAGAPGQPLAEEIRATDQDGAAGPWMAIACHYSDPLHANQFVVQSLEIRIPLGSPADIERKKAVASTLVELFPDKNQYLFASAGPVTLKETPRKGISLKNGSSTLIEHMGNPSPDDNGTQFIHI